MRMNDQGELDDKVVSVASGDPAFTEIFNITQLPVYQHNELRKFFEEYRTLENKEVIVKDFMNQDEALEGVTEAIDFFSKIEKELLKKYDLK